MKTRWSDKYLGRWLYNPFHDNSLWGDKPFFDKKLLSATDDLEAAYPLIRNEVDEVMKRYNELAPFQTMSPDQEYLSQDEGWKFFFLKCAGVNFRKNQAMMPLTMKVIKQHPQIVSAYLSILAPQKRLPPHRGPWPGVLRAHLGVIVPDSQRGRPYLTVARRDYYWKEGKVVLFDDTYEHEAHNPTNFIRVVLFMDVIRPMRFPWNVINRVLISFVWIFPYVWVALLRHRKWSKKFHAEPRD